MQVIPQKLCAAVATMPIKDSKEWCLFDSRRKWLVWLGPRLLEIQNDWNSIFVVISWCAVVSVCCVGKYEALWLVWNLGWLNLWDDLPHGSDAVIAYWWSRDSKGVDSFKLGLLDLLDEGSLGRDMTEQTRQTLWSFETLHAWHIAHVVEIRQVCLQTPTRHWRLLCSSILAVSRIRRWSIKAKILCRVIIIIQIMIRIHHLNRRLVYFRILYSVIDWSSLSIRTRLIQNIWRVSWAAIHILTWWSWSCVGCGWFSAVAVCFFWLRVGLIPAVASIVVQECVAAGGPQVSWKCVCALRTFNLFEILLLALHWVVCTCIGVVNWWHLRHQRVRSVLARQRSKTKIIKISINKKWKTLLSLVTFEHLVREDLLLDLAVLLRSNTMELEVARSW